MHVDGKSSIDLSLVETILKIYTFPGACIEESVVCMCTVMAWIEMSYRESKRESDEKISIKSIKT